jgi:transaldolase
MTKLHDLYERCGQSAWIDDLKRSYLTSGELARLIDQGVRGVTSNPTIMAKAIEGGSDYDEQFERLVRAGVPVEDVYWELVIEDVVGALDAFRPLYDASGGTDGFVSVEVAPDLAHDTAGTIAAARRLHERIGRPNLLVKIPATPEGIPAIEEMIAEGRSTNVTLIFSLERYHAVIDAYLAGLRRLVAAGGDPGRVASVASFFVSRVDTEVDRRLEAVAASADEETARRAHALRGTVALAQARAAYELFRHAFDAPAFADLAGRGARVQRPLWASTSTKNPAYPDLLYVDGLIGPDTVNTMPLATLEAFLDHGTVERTVDTDLPAAHAALAEAGALGLDLREVTDLLEQEGVAAFAKSFDGLLDDLRAKAAALGARS